MYKKKAALHNLGCKVNAYETEAAAESLEKAGYEIVPFTEKADVYVINTCSVTNVADKKSRQMVHRARRLNPAAVIVAMGCYVQTDKGGALIDEGAADIMIGNDRKKDIAEIIAEYEREKVPVSSVGDLTRRGPYEPLSVKKNKDGRVRSFIKVQDGCDMFCSYCIIPYVRGRVRSRAAEDAVKEAAVLAKGGCKEIVVSGIHLSSYGKDFNDGTGLLSLIRALHDVDGIERIRLGSLEPGIITGDFAGELAHLNKVCPHFHLSLQSGCDRILKLMNRRYDTVEYRRKCGILRERFDNPSITTDIITGFPGESDKDFEETFAFVDSMDFFETHVFPYSERAGTRAAQFPDRLTEAVKKSRTARLIELSNNKRERHLVSLEGKEKEVLIEERRESGGGLFMLGHTREYEKVAVSACGSEIQNKIVTVRLTGLASDGCASGVVISRPVC